MQESPDVYCILIDNDYFYDSEFLSRHSHIQKFSELVPIFLSEKRSFTVKFEPADFADSYFDRNDCMIFG